MLTVFTQYIILNKGNETVRDLKGKTMIRPNMDKNDLKTFFCSFQIICKNFYHAICTRITCTKFCLRKKTLKKKNSSSKAVTSMISRVYKFMTRSLKYPGMETEINLPNKRDSRTILWSNIYSENWSFPMFPPTFRVLVWFKAVLLAICKFWRWIMELKFCRALKIIPLNWRMCKKWGEDAIPSSCF